MTGFKEPDMGAGAQTFLQESIGYFRDAFMSVLTRIGSPHFRALQVYCAVPRRGLVFHREFVERMMAPGNSHSESQKKQMAPEAPSVDVQLEGARSANQGITVMLLTPNTLS